MLSTTLIAALSLFKIVVAEVAPEITWVVEGYNFVAKLPCLGCPYLYQDTSQGANQPWSERQDGNALLLNVSLPYDRSIISVNHARIWPAPSTPQNLQATQVLLDISPPDLEHVLSHQREAGHETPLGGLFTLSHRHSLRHISQRAALVFHLDIADLYSDLPDPPLHHPLDEPDQKLLKMILLQKPILSARDAPSFEIIQAELVPRTRVSPALLESWDASDPQPGALVHLLSPLGALINDFLVAHHSQLWFLILMGVVMAVVMAVVLLFFVIGLYMLCLRCCPCLWVTEYSCAQMEKAVDRQMVDEEMGMEKPTRAEEFLFGLLGDTRSDAIGVGKSD